MITKRKKVRVIQPLTETRKLMEQDVRANHKCINEKFIRTMPVLILLAYSHPLYRSEYASALYDAGEITEREKILHGKTKDKWMKGDS